MPLNLSNLPQDDEINIYEIIGPILRFWKQIIILSLFFTILAFIYVKFSGPIYEAKAYIKVGSIGGSVPLEPLSQTKIIMESPEIRNLLKSKILEFRPTFPENKAYNVTKSIIYTDSGGLLNLVIRSSDKELAKYILKVASDIILKRHNVIYNNNKSEMRKSIKWMIENISPLPVSTGINEFKINPSELTIAPYVSDEPVWPKSRHILILTFFISIFLLSFSILIYETLKKYFKPSGTFVKQN